ncbi:MAG: transporter substrate-binding domain-containing protein [Oscillospiraceae bacterium]|nr:transporter substrate-binding domain-containing protein [Oscillospiraceae bacterium]
MKRSLWRVMAVAMALVAIAALSSCSGGGGGSGGKLICGITEYKPMNYRENNVWTGFDTEFAQLVGQKLGMEVEFQLIDWDRKFDELNSGAITCIWNGLTANSDEDGTPRAELADMTYSYMLNQQCVVVLADRIGELSTKDALSGKNIAVEASSAGEGEAKKLTAEDKIIKLSTQMSAFVEVKSGASDCAIVDILLAQQIAGTGDYADLAIARAVQLDAEVYAVGFKKGSDLTAKVNKAMKELDEAGTLATLAEKYKLQNSYLLDTSFGK